MPKEIRKAAVLFSSLDPPSAESLLAQLDPDMVRRIREAARNLRAVDPREQQEVLEEFFAKKKDGPAAAPAEKLASAAGDEVVLQHADRAPPARRPFQFLETIDPEQLAARLAKEHPQMIAIVAANAPRRLAAELLCRLPAPLRGEVLVRVIDGRPTEPQLLEELEQALEVSLAAFSHSPTAAAGLEAAREILEAAGASERRELLNDLAKRDVRRAELLRSPASHEVVLAEKPVSAETSAAATKNSPPQPRRSGEANERPATLPFAPAARGARTPKPNSPRSEIAFAEFAKLDDRALLRVFAAADPQSALLALVGARQQLVNRLMRRLSRKEAAQLQRRMETLGPFRLEDIETAQQELARIAGRLVSRQRRAA